MKWPQVVSGKVQVGRFSPGEFLHRKHYQALEWALKRSSRVTIPGSVKEPTGHCTCGYGLVHIVVFSKRLDLMIL